MSAFVWYDLMTPDMKASSDFYSHVVGWSVADSGMPGMNYSMLKTDGADVGGLMPMPPGLEGMPPMWNGYVYVDDVDASARKAAKLGGQVFQEPQDIPGVGRFAVLTDPSRASFLIFKDTSGQPQPKPAAMGQPGHIVWRELMSSDWQEAWRFYSGMFGWTKSTAIDMGPMGTYQMFAVNGEDHGGMMTKTPDDPSPPHWNYYFGVESIAAGIARAESKGARFHGPAMEVPGGGWAVNGVDPQGAAFSLFSNNS
jgi:uncharacterized protein